MDLHSRVHRIEFNGGHRDVLIHEMTESEIRMLKSERWMYLAVGAGVGAVATFVCFSVAIRALCGVN